MKTSVHVILSVIFLLAVYTNAQTTEFTYQGNLSMTGSPANGTFDFEFALFATLASGTPIASTLSRNGVVVTNGSFAVKLNFGPEFPGADRFLEIRVRNSGAGAFTPLTPRQQINSSPYSIRSTSAESAAIASTALNSTQLGGVAANQYLQINGNGSGLTNLNAGNIATGTLPIANGGTGSSTKNFVDLSTDQTGIGGNKSFTGKIGVGTDPTAKLEVLDSSNNGLRVQTNAVGGTVASFGGNGAFNIDASGVVGGRFTVLQNGNVGIGTPNPSSRLEIAGNALIYPIAGDSILNIRNRTNSNYSQTVYYDAGGNYRAYIGYMGSTTGFGAQRNDTVEFGTSGKHMTFRPNEAEVMRLTAGGNVGIGVTDPGFLLDVGQRMRLRSGGNNNVSAGLYFNNNANAIAAFTGMEDDTHVGWWGSGAGWKFGMNTATGGLRVNGSEGQAGQVITSNGAAPSQWKSPTNSLYQSTNISLDSAGVSLGADALIPGLSQTVNVTGNAKLLIQFSLTAGRSLCVGCNASTAVIDLLANGGLANRIFQTVVPSSDNYVSSSWSLAVGTGSYTIEVHAHAIGGNINFGCGPGCTTRSHLIVQVIPE